MDNCFMQVIGNIGRSPENQFTDTGKLFSKATVAVETGWGDRKDTLWIGVTVWGEESATRFKEFCQKGTKVYLSGTPSVNVWKSKEGEARGQINLTVKEFRVLSGGRPKETEESDNPYEGSQE